MEFLPALWIPILVSAVAVFVVSSIIHMVLPYHKSNMRKLPGEDVIQKCMREQGVTPGQYALPMPASMKDMTSPEMVAKYESGPVAIVTVIPSRVPDMKVSLVAWFVYSLVVSFFAAYIGWLAFGPAPYLSAFRVTGAVAVLAYATSTLHDSIWGGVSWSTTSKFVFDGVVYGLVTAGVFGWLWPAA